MASSTSKVVTFVVIAVVNIVLALSPEFIPETWKTALEATLGSNYAYVWTAVFVLLALLSTYFTWSESKGGNTVKIKGDRNKSNQGSVSSSKSNDAEINGNDNENTQI